MKKVEDLIGCLYIRTSLSRMAIQHLSVQLKTFCKVSRIRVQM